VPFVDIGSTELFYADDRARDAAVSEDCILLQSWVLGSHADFSEWLPTLCERWRVIRMDRRGTGRSPAPPIGFEFSAHGLVDDTLRFLDALEIERVHYVGQRLGAILGAMFAAAHPDRVQTLVMSSAPLRIFDRAYKEGVPSVTAMGTWRYVHTSWLERLSLATSVDEALLELRWAEQAAVVAPHVVESLIRMVRQSDFDLTPTLPLIAAPTLLVSAEIDELCPLEEQAMMCGLIPDCRHLVLGRGGRTILPIDAEVCARAAAEFIGSAVQESA
jgi:3-oxoadipate enol-lactonase